MSKTVGVNPSRFNALNGGRFNGREKLYVIRQRSKRMPNAEWKNYGFQSRSKVVVNQYIDDLRKFFPEFDYKVLVI